MRWLLLSLVLWASFTTPTSAGTFSYTLPCGSGGEANVDYGQVFSSVESLYLIMEGEVEPIIVQRPGGFIEEIPFVMDLQMSDCGNSIGSSWFGVWCYGHAETAYFAPCRSPISLEADH